MKTVSIHDGHSASVALMVDGAVVYAIQEERLTKIKNTGGFPHQALNDLLINNEMLITDIDHFIFVGNGSATPMKAREYHLEKYSRFFKRHDLEVSFLSKAKNKIKSKLKNVDPAKIVGEKRKLRVEPLIAEGISETKISFIDHHLCHAAAAAYGWGKNETYAVVTSDSSGDGISGTVNLFEDGELTRLSEIKIGDSIARIYSLITYYLGMVPMEHEYKLMGMAPYAENDKAARNMADY